MKMHGETVKLIQYIKYRSQDDIHFVFYTNLEWIQKKYKKLSLVSLFIS
jgi:hypothetical protein